MEISEETDPNSANMLEYKYTAELGPNWLFGLPYENRLVVPGGTQVTSDAIEAGTLRKVRHGTLSIYRKEEEKIRFTENLDGMTIELDDNFIIIALMESDGQVAFYRVLNFLNDYVKALSLTSGFKISFEIISGYDQNNRSAPIQRTLSWPIMSYDLKDLSKQITRSFDIIQKTNQELKKSLAYYDHALFLNAIRMKQVPGTSGHYYYLLSDIILNLNKSVTVIIGDPSKEKDYQRRYKEFGIDYEFWKEKIEKLRTIRNEWDVAHHHLTDEKLKELNAHIIESFNTTRQTILKYVHYLS